MVSPVAASVTIPVSMLSVWAETAMTVKSKANAINSLLIL